MKSAVCVLITDKDKNILSISRKDKVANFNESYLFTNQTEALSFDMFNIFDLIIVHNTSK